MAPPDSLAGRPEHRLVGRALLPKQPLRRPKLYEMIATKLEEWIGAGRFKEGETLPSERELMQVFGVGRTSVREALFALSRMGLVKLQPGGKPVVVRPDAGTVLNGLSGIVRYLLADPKSERDFQEARSLWEGAVARVAATKAGPDAIAELEQALEANRQALGDLQAFIQTDIEFHYRIASISGNPLFTSLHEAFTAWLVEQRSTSIAVPEAAQAAYRAHRRIFQAIAAHEAEAAQRAMAEHLDEVARYYWGAKEHYRREARNSDGP